MTYEIAFHELQLTWRERMRTPLSIQNYAFHTIYIHCRHDFSFKATSRCKWTPIDRVHKRNKVLENVKAKHTNKSNCNAKSLVHIAYSIHSNQSQ